MKYGFVKTAVITYPERTLNGIFNIVKKAHALGAQLLYLPKFTANEDKLAKLATLTKMRDIAIFAPCDIALQFGVFKGIAALSGGVISAISLALDIPKSQSQKYTPYSQNVFKELEISNFIVPVRNDLIFNFKQGMLSVCFNLDSDFAQLKKRGVNVLLFAPENRFYDEQDSDKNFLLSLSKISSCAVISENCIAECGDMLCQDKRLLLADIDTERINFVRMRRCSFLPVEIGGCVPLSLKRDFETLDRTFDKYPLAIKTKNCAEHTIKILTHAINETLKCSNLKYINLPFSMTKEYKLAKYIIDRFCKEYSFPYKNIIKDNITAERALHIDTTLLSFMPTTPYLPQETLRIFSGISATTLISLLKFTQIETLQYEKIDVLNDFLLYNSCANGYEYRKLCFLVRHVFKDEYNNVEIKKTLRDLSERLKRSIRICNCAKIFDFDLINFNLEE